MKKFNPKEYQQKARVYVGLKQHPRISKVWVWNVNAAAYEPPARGNSYVARKYDINRKRQTAYFQNLEDAKDWQRLQENVLCSAKSSGRITQTFEDVVLEWKTRKYSTLAESTKDQYEKLLSLYFRSLLAVNIEDFSPSTVDNWIDYLKNPGSGHVTKIARKSFEPELTLLSTILKYYAEYHDESDYRYPIKKRHRDAIQLKKDSKVRPKDFTEEEFLRFRDKLLGLKRGAILFNLATIQYYQALRVSEVAAIHFDDIRLDFNNPSSSRIKISKSIFWSRTKKQEPKILNSFKNSSSNGGVKEQPLMPKSFEVLKKLYTLDNRGLIFSELNGDILCYKNIKAAYNRAFRLAGLPYSGTHVLRHGMTRKVYNDTGDLAIAGQLLGNTTQDSIQVYAKRSTKALTEYTQTQWDKFNEVVASGRK